MELKTTILYIDDEEINLMLFETNFGKLFNVLTSSSGNAGLEILRSKPEIKLVICDMKMPNMDGVEFVGKAKSEFPEVYYIILTGYSLNETISEALKSGLIHKSFSKPFSISEMKNVIYGLLNPH